MVDGSLILLLCFVPVYAALGMWWAWITANSKGWHRGFKEGADIWKAHSKWLEQRLLESLKRGRD